MQEVMRELPDGENVITPGTEVLPAILHYYAAVNSVVTDYIKKESKVSLTDEVRTSKQYKNNYSVINEKNPVALLSFPIPANHSFVQNKNPHLSVKFSSHFSL